MLPVTAGRLFWSKIVFAVVSTLVMIAVLWPAAMAFSAGRLPSAGQTAGLWALWGFAAVELLVWGTLFSLLSTQPLKATILAVATTSVVVHLTTAHYIRSPADYFYLEPYRDALPPRMAIALLVGLVDVWLGARWFRETASAVRERPVGRKREAGVAGRSLTVSREGGFARLVWQAFRQNASMIGVFGLLTVPMALLGSGAWAAAARGAGQFSRKWTFSNQSLPVLSLLLILLVSLIGASTFLADQRMSRFRFLAERGVSPRAVWWSRQLVWMAVATVPVIVIGIAMLPMLPWLFRDEVPLYAQLAGLSCVAMAYAAGQFCSMVFRSGVLAAVFGAVLAGLLSIWTVLMAAGGVPWLWSVAPIPLVLLVATRVRTPNWLRERGGLRGWMPMMLALALPGAAILTAVPFYRAYEIPVVSLGFSPAEYFRPPNAEEKATLEMYREALRLADQGDEEKSLKLALEASKRPACDCFDPLGRDMLFPKMAQLAHQVISNGSDMEQAGRLVEAFDRYLAALRISVQLRQRAGQLVVLYAADPVERAVQQRLLHWSTAPGQTPERVRKAVARLEQITDDLPSRTSEVASQYFVLRRLIDGDTEAMAQEGWDEEQIIRTALWLKWMPWERARAHRLLNSLTARAMDQMRDVESAMANGVKVPPQFYTLRYGFHPEDARDDWLRQHFRLLWSSDHGAPEAMNMETRRRAVRLVLAIEAWKLEHRRLPETLDVLIGTSLDQIPLDPYSAEPFRWFPEGVDVAIVPADVQKSDEVVPPNVPIVWSAGPLVLFRESGDSLLERSRVRQAVYYDEWRQPSLELQLWQAGWAFPVP
jgi:ABC-type transport system involved in multi-copper enzyme maturation permease subunit